MPNETSPTPEPNKNVPLGDTQEPSVLAKEEDESLQNKQPPAEPESPIPQVDWEAQIKELEEEVTKLHHEKLRALADLQNFRRRALTQIAEARQDAIGDFATELLPILDNFERAIQAGANDAPKEALIEGLSLTHRQLTEVLRAFQIEPIPSLGEPFNPLLHEAVTAEETEGPPGIILEEIQKGYKMGNKVLRPAKVKVSKPIPAPTKEALQENKQEDKQT